MKLTKRILSFLLVFAMLCTVMPMGLTAAAEEAETPAAPEEAVTIPGEADSGDAQTDAAGTPIPVLGETLELEPWINPFYKDIPLPDNFPEFQPQQKPDASVQTTYLSMDDAILDLRNQLKNRTGYVSVYLHSTNADIDALYTALMDGAMAHNGNPKEGDYIRGHVYGSYGQVSYWRNGYGYDYTFEISVWYMSTAQEEAAVDTAVANLLGELNLGGKSDYDKIRGVYDYMCNNITYDYENLDDPDYLRKHSAYAALIDKTAVCQGYATLFYRLMMELGVDARYITGTGNGGGHAWNIVELDGYYYNVDATWDSSWPYVYHWFLMSTWDFADHWEDSRFRSPEFRTSHPMAAESYQPGVPAQLDPITCYGPCGDYTLWMLSADGEMVITGTGSMLVSEDDRIEAAVTEWQQWARNDIKFVYVDNGVTNIRRDAFSNCENLTEVYLSDTVTDIGENAFSNCSQLTHIELGSGITSIGMDAFHFCRSLSQIELPDSLTNLGEGAFENCESLSGIRIPEGITQLPADAFSGCFALQQVQLPSALEAIGSRAFSNCSQLSSVTLPEDLQTIGDNAFSSCSSLPSITFPASITSIGSYAFAWCYDLKNMSFEGAAPEIGYDCFYGCKATAEYSEDSGTWTEEKRTGYGGRITWITDCVHEYESVVTPPTCTEQGYTTHTCTLCGKMTVSDYVDALGHTPGEVQVENEIPATCAALGSCDHVIYCTVCSEELDRESVVLNLLPHTPGETQVENETEATCTAEGSYDEVVYCTECGAELSRQTKVTEMLSHVYDEAVTPPTCTGQGFTTYTCTLCGHEYTDHITDMLAHTPGDIQVENETVPTCAAEGSYDEVVYCTECGLELSRETVSLEPLAHDYAAEVTAPTCTEQGFTTHTCRSCGDTYADSYVEALGHSFQYSVTLEPGKRESGILTGTCQTCGAEDTVAMPMLNEEDYTFQILQEPTEEETGLALYTWNVTEYGTFSFEVTLPKLNDVLLGDVNGDDIIDTTDAYLIVLYYNERMELDETQLAAADVNGDGSVDTTDAYYIVLFYNEKIDSFPT